MIRRIVDWIDLSRTVVEVLALGLSGVGDPVQRASIARECVRCPSSLKPLLIVVLGWVSQLA